MRLLGRPERAEISNLMVEVVENASSHPNQIFGLWRLASRLSYIADSQLVSRYAIQEMARANERSGKCAHDSIAHPAKTVQKPIQKPLALLCNARLGSYLDVLLPLAAWPSLQLRPACPAAAGAHFKGRPLKLASSVRNAHGACLSPAKCRHTGW